MVVLWAGVWPPLRIGLMDCTLEIVYFRLNMVFLRDYLRRFSSWAICSNCNSIYQSFMGSCSLFSSISLSWLQRVCTWELMDWTDLCLFLKLCS
jgi:hypothetical protein